LTVTQRFGTIDPSDGESTEKGVGVGDGVGTGVGDGVGATSAAVVDGRVSIEGLAGLSPAQAATMQATKITTRVRLIWDIAS
jgi:hypothetical protein